MGEGKSGLLFVLIVAIVGVVGITCMLTSIWGGNTQSGTDTYGNVVATNTDSATLNSYSTTSQGSTADSVPRIAYWQGKVNQHFNTTTGKWTTDPDGVSGTNVDMLSYCKKWYPNTTKVEEYKLETVSDWRDKGNNGHYKSAKKSYRCVNGTSPAIKCVDSDNGKNYFVKGNVTGVSKDGNGIANGGVDYCGTAPNANVLMEGFCDSGYVNFISYACPNGCSDGACLRTSCIAIPCAAPPQGCTYKNPTYDSNNCATSCGQLVCDSTPGTCTDSDGGMNYSVKGTVSNADSTPIESNGAMKEGNYDSGDAIIKVLSSTTVNLTIFNESKIVIVHEYAQYSIFGIRINNITFLGLGNPDNTINIDILSQKDFCTVDGILMETYCDGGRASSKYITCQNGCNDGTCIGGIGTDYINNHTLIPYQTMFPAPLPNIDNAVVRQQGTNLSVSVPFRNNLGSAIAFGPGVDGSLGPGVTCNQGMIIYAEMNGAPVATTSTSTIPNGATFTLTWVCMGATPQYNNGDRIDLALQFYYTNVNTAQRSVEEGTVSSVIIIDAIPASNSLSSYPEFLFDKSNAFIGQIVIGNLAPPEDVTYATDIAAFLSRYAGSVKGVANYATGMAVLDNAASYTKPSIIINTPCANTFAAYYLGVSTQCSSGYEPGVGRLDFLTKNGQLAIIVGGYYSDDIKVAALVLAQWSNYESYVVAGKSLCMTHTNGLTSISAYACDPIIVGIPVISNCNDSDSGNNPTVYGQTCDANGCAMDYCNYAGNKNNVLVERVCENNVGVDKIVVCSGDKPYCYEGACSSTVPTCNDSDGGINPETYGSVTPHHIPNVSPYNDYCELDNVPTTSCVGSTCNVREFYCDGLGIGFSDISCPNGCSNGACISTPTPSTNATLTNYPQPFITTDRIATGVFIVGRKAAIDDVIGITDIVASLQRYAGNNPFPVGLVKFDDEVSSMDIYNRDLVIVGGVCANTMAAEFLGNTADCAARDTPGVGKIEIMSNKNSMKRVLLVHGYSADDTTRATRVLANWESYKDLFKDATSLCVTGTINSPIVQKCPTDVSSSTTETTFVPLVCMASAGVACTGAPIIKTDSIALSVVNGLGYPLHLETSKMSLGGISCPGSTNNAAICALGDTTCSTSGSLLENGAGATIVLRGCTMSANQIVNGNILFNYTNNNGATEVLTLQVGGRATS